MGVRLQALFNIALPGLILGLAAVSRGELSRLDDQQLALVAYAPYLLAGLVTLLAYQFNRSRFLLLAVLGAGSYWVVRNHLQVSFTEPLAEQTYLALGLTWPLGIILLALLPERGIANRWGFVYTLSIAVLVLAAPRLVTLCETLLQSHPGLLSTWPTDYLVLPGYICAMFLAAFTVAVVQLLRRGDEAAMAIFTTLLAGFAVLGFFHLPFVSIAMLTAAGVTQTVSLLRSSHAMAYRDELTGLLGRRALNERLNGLGPRYSLAMLDVDYFKKLNDNHGHYVGDEVLKLVASRIARVGSGGIAYRYGGEEFCVVFPRRSVEECIAALEDTREAVANYEMTLRDKGRRPVKVVDGERLRSRMATRVRTGTVSVTISMGLVERSEDVWTPEEVIKAADQQLYRAKKTGRNRLCY